MSQRKILFVDACISEHIPSRTKTLCHAFLDEFQKIHGDTQVETVSLIEHPVPALTHEALMTRNSLVSSNQLQHPMFDMAHQFAEAELIVIGAPYWDLSFPAVLKSYIEQIMVTNVAFHYIETGSEGLCRAKALVYLTSAGDYIDSTNNFGYDYIRGIAAMVGISQTYFCAADGLDIQGNDIPQIMKKAVADTVSICSSL